MSDREDYFERIKMTKLLRRVNQLFSSQTELEERVSIIPPKGKKVFADRLLVYYGYPIAYKGLYTVDAVVDSIAANYEIYIVGDEYQKPTHEVYADTVNIINGLVAKGVKVYGYVPLGSSTLNRSIPVLQEAVDDWITAGVTGIFVDEFGMDYNSATPIDYRQRQIDIVDYIHSKGLPFVANSFEPVYTLSDNLAEVEAIYGVGSFVSNTYAAGNPQNKSLTRTSEDAHMFENWAVDNSGLVNQFGTTEKAFYFKQLNKEGVKKWALGVLPETTQGVLDTSKFSNAARPQTVFEIAELVWASSLIQGMDAVGVHGFSFGSAGGGVQFDAPYIAFLQDILQSDIGDTIQPTSFTAVTSRFFGNTELKVDFASDFATTYNGTTNAIFTPRTIVPFSFNNRGVALATV